MLPITRSHPTVRRRPWRDWLTLALVCWAYGPARGQFLPNLPPEPDADPIPRVKLALADWAAPACAANAPACRPYRFPLFRMPTGFLSEPVDVLQEDDPAAEDPETS